MNSFKYILLLTFVVLLSACGAKKTESNSNQAVQQSIDVTTADTVLREVPTYFETTGTLASDGQTDVSPNIAGKIIEVNFDVGSYVNKGDVLVRIDPRDAKYRLDQALAQVNQQQNMVNQAEAQVNQSKQGIKQAESNVDQAIASLRQTQARLGVKDGETFNIETFSQVRSINAQLVLAEKELGRAEKLLASGDVSRSIRDQRLAQRDQLLGQLVEAKSNAAVSVKAIDIAQSAVNTAKQGVATAQAQMATAQANVNNARAGVATAQTGVEMARKAVSDSAIYAPISGYVSERIADVGEFTNPNVPNSKIATILRTAVLRLKMDIPEQNIGKVAEGQSVSLKVSAYPDRNFAGTVTRILPALNPTSRTLTVEAEVESGGILKPGLFATARILQAKPESALLVPQEAVRTDGGISKVFVIADGRATEKLIQLGDAENNLIQIKQGLAQNDKVAITNVGLLFDGVTVKQ